MGLRQFLVKMQLFPVTEQKIDFGDQHSLRVRLGGASCNDDPGVRAAHPPRPARQPSALPVGLRRDRTTVDDVDVRLAAERDEFVPGSGAQVLHGFALGVIELASQVRQGETQGFCACALHGFARFVHAGYLQLLKNATFTANLTLCANWPARAVSLDGEAGQLVG